MTSVPVELARCPEHDIVCLEEPTTGSLDHCPACGLGLEIRLDVTPENEHLSDIEFRTRMEWDSLVDLVPVLEAYLDDRLDHEVELWATHLPWDGTLPAGYSEQERFVFVLGYRFNAWQKYIITETEASETLETLVENGYDTV